MWIEALRMCGNSMYACVTEKACKHAINGAYGEIAERGKCCFEEQ